MRLIGYLRTSTDEQENGLEAQRHTILARYPDVDEMVADHYSGKTLDRPVWQSIEDRLDGNEELGVVVAKLDRLTRSVVDLGLLLERFDKAGAVLIALDVGVDTSTPTGRLVANIMASVAQWEREAISQRTKDALAAKRANGETISRPAVIDDPDTLAMIREWRQAGATLQTIADNLNKLGVPTLRGGKCWRPSALQAALS